MAARAIYGVRRDLEYSKKDLVLLHRLIIMGLNRKLDEARSSRPELAADTQYLVERGFMTQAGETLAGPINASILGLGFLFQDYDPEADTWRSESSYELALKLVQMGLLHVGMVAASVPESERDRVSLEAKALRLPPGAECVVAFLFNTLMERTTLHQGISSEAVAVAMRRRPLSYPELMELASIIQAAPDVVESSPTSGILTLVLKNLPVPGDSVPLDAILDFAEDPETRRLTTKLQLWLERAAHSGKELADIGLEIDEGLHEFANHMRLADMRQTTTGLRMLLTVPLGVIEELVHLRPRKALDVVFQYRDAKATRLEAELSAPGGAFAYIYEAERRFAKPDRGLGVEQ